MNARSGGASLQSYPEPAVDSGGAPAVDPADCDGNLQLATVELDEASPFYSARAGGKRLMMFAGFDDGYVLDEASGSDQVDADAGMASGSELSNGLWHGAKPVTFYPDGIYSEAGRAPAYASPGNADGFHGVISTWVKPGYRRCRVAERSGIFIGSGTRGRRFFQWTNYRGGTEGNAYNPNQAFASADALALDIGYQEETADDFTYRAFFEAGHRATSGDEHRDEHLYRRSGATTSPHDHLWRLLTVFYDFRAFRPADCGILVIDDRLPSRGETYRSNDLRVMNGLVPRNFSDITERDDLGDHRMALGMRYPREWQTRFCVGSGADATFDEFGIWDFGGAPEEPVEPSLAFTDALFDDVRVFASDRFQEGRYYRGSEVAPLPGRGRPQPGEAPSYFTGRIGLPAGSVIREVHWTWRLPDPADYPTPMEASALAGDYPEVDLVKGNGNDYLWSPRESDEVSRSSAGGAWPDPRGVQFWSVNREAPRGPFRIRVVFRRNTPLGPGVPILESPVLDDLTILYARQGGGWWRAWSEDR